MDKARQRIDPDIFRSGLRPSVVINHVRFSKHEVVVYLLEKNGALTASLGASQPCPQIQTATTRGPTTTETTATAGTTTIQQAIAETTAATETTAELPATTETTALTSAAAVAAATATAGVGAAAIQTDL